MDVDKIAFIGSTEVGKLILNTSAGNLKKVTLKLGGKSPSVVLSDADLESGIPGVASAIFFNHGQCCCAGSRLYVGKSIFDKVVAGAADQAKQITLGQGMNPSTQMGPLVSVEQQQRVLGYLKSGLAEGAEAVVGGKRRGDKGYFVEPIVLVKTTSTMKVIQEEIFGPVVRVEPFQDVDEVIQKANNNIYGLAAAVWTKDLSKAHRIAARLRAGTV